MAGAGKKTFTAGEVLTASDVNSYLMEQSVMVFGGTAARSSAIPTPSTGMTSYIGVTGTASIPQIETYTGSQWQTPYGLTLVASASFTSASAIQVDNVFTTTYDSYKIIFNLTAISGNDIPIRMRFVDGTTPAIVGHYMGGVGISNTGTNVSTYASAASSSIIFYASSALPLLGHASLDIINPKLSSYTNYTFNSYSYNGAITFSYAGAGTITESTTYEGIQFYPNSGTFSGNIKIYGYRNS